jgi:hypothetical protein
MPLRYNQLKSIPIMFCVCLLSGIQCFGQPSQDEENNVKEAVKNYYIKGLETRNFGLIKSICIAEAKLF